MLLKASAFAQPMKCERQCCLPFPFNWTIMEATYFLTPPLSINSRGITEEKQLTNDAGNHRLALIAKNNSTSER